MFWRKDKPKKPEVLLKPGTCECTHGRCFHTDGIGKCNAGIPPDGNYPEWTMCACKVYIRDDDDDDDDEAPETPSPDELEVLYRK